jgi:hypothetical protein
MPGPLDIFPRILLLHLSTQFEPISLNSSNGSFSFPVGTDARSLDRAELLKNMNGIIVHSYGGPNNFYYTDHGETCSFSSCS